MPHAKLLPPVEAPMYSQYWVLPMSGVGWGQTVSGVPVIQLPDTSGVVETLANATAEIV